MDTDLQSIRAEIADARERVSEDVETIGAGTGSIVSVLRSPLTLFLGGLAAGMLSGMVLPLTRFEAERVPPLTNSMKHRVMLAGGQALQRSLQRPH